MINLIKILITTFQLILFSSHIIGQNSWTQKADFGSKGRAYALGFSIGDKGYAGMGIDTNGIYNNDFWEFNPTQNIWTQKANFPGKARTGASSFGINNKGYVICGYTGNYKNTNEVWQYDPSNDTWTQKGNFPGMEREYAVSFCLNNKGYIGTGFNSVSPNFYFLNDFWEYNPTSDTWTQKADFGGGGRTAASGFSIGNKGYVGTGYFVNNKNDFWEFNPTSNTWTQKANYAGVPITGAIGFSIDNKGYIGTGMDSNNYYKNDFWQYDSEINSWTQKANCSTNLRYVSVSFGIGNKGYVGMGLGNKNLKDFWEYNPYHTGIKENENINGFKIFPNPNCGIFNVESSVPIISYEINEISGKIISKFLTNDNPTSIEIILQLPKGIYYIMLNTNEGTIAKKIILTND